MKESLLLRIQLASASFLFLAACAATESQDARTSAWQSRCYSSINLERTDQDDLEHIQSRIEQHFRATYPYESELRQSTFYLESLSGNIVAISESDVFTDILVVYVVSQTGKIQEFFTASALGGHSRVETSSGNISHECR